MKEAVVAVAVVVAVLAAVWAAVQEPEYNTTLGAPQYDLFRQTGPRVSGIALSLVVAIAKTPFLGDALLAHLRQENRFGEVLAIGGQVHLPPTYYPTSNPTPKQVADAQRAAEEGSAGNDLLKPYSPDAVAKSRLEAALKAPDFLPRSVSDFHVAYVNGLATPTKVARALIKAVEGSDQKDLPLRAFSEFIPDDVLQQAAESDARYAKGSPISVLDGVPIAVKCEVDVKGYRTTYGTKFRNVETAAIADAAAVARLRALGAIVIGGANMHEIGLGVTGQNVHHGPAKNPYNPAHHTGGSSSGSASAVAAGLVPAALGTDGGGSIRIPAGFCGVFGLKATFGRVPIASSSAWSVVHIGPIASTVNDAELLYIATAGADDADLTQNKLAPPPNLIDTRKLDDLSDITIGVFPEYFKDADAEIVANAQAAIDELVSRGAKVKEIVLPNLSALRSAHITTIAAEIATAQLPYSKNFEDFSYETQLMLKLAGSFGGAQLLSALKLRTYLIDYLKQLFTEIDVIATPNTATTAPPIPDAKAGELSVENADNTMRFMFIGNFAGNPGIAIPTGLSSDGLPTSLQLMSSWWDEAVLLRLARVAGTRMEQPPVWHDVLGNAVKSN